MEFEEALPVFDKIISLYRQKWTLSSYPYDDIAQDLRIRAFQKFHLYDSKKGTLEAWMATLTQNYIKNELRNRFYIFTAPCLRCDMFLGENQCKLYGEVSTKCALYKKFVSQKENASNVNFPVSYEASEYDARQEFNCDSKDLAKEIYVQVSGIHSEIFTLFFESGFSVTRIAKYIQISGFNMKKRQDFVQESLDNTYERAKEILEDKKIAAGAYNG